VGELPGEEQGCEEPASERVLGEEQVLPGVVLGGGGLACGGGPAHEGGNAAHDCAYPRIEDGDAFHGRVDAGVEEDVEGGECGDGGVGAQVEESEAAEAGCEREEGGGGWGDEFADEGSVARPGHEGVVFGLEEHVESVGRGGGEECAGCEVCQCECRG
jgi:hypothetical protein